MESIIELLLVLNFVFCSCYSFDERMKAVNLDETKHDSKLKELYFEQKLDHFDSNNNDKWSQRYWHKNSKNARRAILFIHNAHIIPEMEMFDKKLIDPLTGDLNTACFHLENRFYGKSKPRNDTTLESLRYLSSEQALADIANFIRNIGKTYGYLVHGKVKWVTFGISYGGSLATWARYKYPDLIDSAIAINAPLLAKMDFKEYFQNVAKSINSYNPACGKKITSANRELKELIKSGKNSKNILETFKLCDDMTENADDVSTLFYELAQNFAIALDFNAIAMRSKPLVSVKELCDIMLKSNASSVQSYAQVNRLNLKNRLDLERGCFDYKYKNVMDKLKKTDYDAAMNDRRQWIYQTCTEFGFFTTSSRTSGMFGDNFPASFFAKQCQELFGPEFHVEKIKENVSNTNKKYGGLEIDVNKAIFIYYSENPWRSLFVTHHKSGYYEVIKFDENLHHQDDEKFGKEIVFPDFLTKVEEIMRCVFNGVHCSSNSSTVLKVKSNFQNDYLLKPGENFLHPNI